MNPSSIENIAQTMRMKGIFLFRDALIEALNNDFDTRKCLVHVVHAAEIILKARIAQEHPLLIFTKVPKLNPAKITLTFVDLLENGHTLSYEELPDRLWAATGIKIENENLETYKQFGKIRNQIIHTSMTISEVLNDQIWLYSFKVLDPLVRLFWGHSVIEFITNDPKLSPHNSISFRLVSRKAKLKAILPSDQRFSQILEDNFKEWEEEFSEEVDALEIQQHYEIMDEYERSKTPQQLAFEEAQMEEYASEYANAIEFKESKWKALLEEFQLL